MTTSQSIAADYWLEELAGAAPAAGAAAAPAAGAAAAGAIVHSHTDHNEHKIYNQLPHTKHTARGRNAHCNVDNLSNEG